MTRVERSRMGASTRLAPGGSLHDAEVIEALGVAIEECIADRELHLVVDLGATTWYLALGVFLAFRFFDITKPWPVKQSQAIPNGWGVVLDDLLAAVYVNLVILLVHLGLQFF